MIEINGNMYYSKDELAPIDRMSGDSGKPKKKKHIVRKIVDLVLFLLAVCVIVGVVVGCTHKSVYIIGSSMENTLTGASSEDEPGGDYILVNPRKDPERGDIVVVGWDKDGDGEADENIVKRVIALEGDTVEIIDKVVYVNGEELYEDYVSPRNNDAWRIQWDVENQEWVESFEPVTLTRGQMYLLGDNRNVSNDSRLNGAYYVEDTVGVATGFCLSIKGVTTGFYNFFENTLPGWFGRGFRWASD